MSPPPVPIRREIVLGRNSTVWRRLATHPALAGTSFTAIGHHDLSGFDFSSHDRVWVFSYSRVPAENHAMLARLGAAGVAEIAYLSSSSAIVTRRTRCWEYPRVKQQAEDEALALPNGKVLTVGLMHADAAELPAGDNIATSYDMLADFMRSPAWTDGDGRRRHLFRIEPRPYRSGLERALARLYGAALDACGTQPCLLRPIDLLLRLLGMRWYGYTFLSNRLWTSTTS
ncbi:MAG: hypothetical protein E6Q93_26370 [Burkholderiaceae bacterium]|nr:MAG: hypothetical protein E6Q93_26370 [Burkholderiaceae bacterium]